MAVRFPLPRATVLSVAITVFVSPAAAAQTPVTPATQELTPVQEAFVNRKPPSMLDAARDESPPAADFTPTRRSKVFLYSLQLMSYEQLMRVATQADSRSELGGPFFKDWFDSVHLPRKWGDGDHWQVNYIGHAIHGAAAARIWLDHRERRATTKAEYLRSMGRALVFTTIFSELFENGPISEASIGNVTRRAERTGWVDHVWTPVGGVLWAMAEDAIDKYVLAQIDKRVPSLLARAAARMILNPGRMLANVAQNRVPWHRRDRPIALGMTVGR
jgi:hypothetical protein